MKSAIKVSRQNTYRIISKGTEAALRKAQAQRAIAEAEQAQQEMNDLLMTLASTNRDIPDGHNFRFDPASESIIIEPAENKSRDSGETNVRNLPLVNGRARAASAGVGIGPSADNSGGVSSEGES